MALSPDWLNDKYSRLERKNAFDGSLVHGTSKFNRDTGRNSKPVNPFQAFIDPETNLIRQELTRPRNCPVCGAPPGEGLFIKDGFRHVRCPSCGLIYVSLILRDEIMIKYWREEMAWNAVLRTGPQTDMDKLKFAYGLELASSHAPGELPGTLLDVGAGTGTFIRLADGRGWKTTALELNVESAETMESEGYQVIVKPLELADLSENAYDMVTLWEVLEHLAEPKIVLSNTRELLTSGGVLLILVPNSGSLVTRILHEKSNTFGGHSHLNHFNPSSMKILLESLDYEILEMETVLTELGTIYNHLDFQDPYLGDAPETIPQLTPELIHDKLWGSRLLVVAKKADDS
ncbi:MAG: methyltransferase domain-containing protein [Deltaproteobacteria bacterium]|jgi:SAM-dependent methyltransferase|nr:methyltransferase domain-containing protein [Deltaproteobacteria bacterium]